MTVHCLTVQPTDHLLSATLFSNSLIAAQTKILNPTVSVNRILWSVTGESVTARVVVKRWNFRNAAELQKQTEQTATAATSTKKGKDEQIKGG